MQSILRNWKAAHPGDAAFFIPALLEQLVAAGRLGRKSGRGFYEWNGNACGLPAPL